MRGQGGQGLGKRKKPNVEAPLDRCPRTQKYPDRARMVSKKGNCTYMTPLKRKKTEAQVARRSKIDTKKQCMADCKKK